MIVFANPGATRPENPPVPMPSMAREAALATAGRAYPHLRRLTADLP